MNLEEINTLLHSLHSFDAEDKASSVDHILKHPMKPIVQILFGASLICLL